MKRNHLLISALAILAFALHALSAEETNLKPLVDGNTAFALDLYAKLRSSPGNLALSPYSISLGLAMTCSGARGKTARQMEQALHFAPAKTNQHELYGRLNAALMGAKGNNELTIANSLWPQNKYPFQDAFLTQIKTNYGATVTPLDFGGNPNQASVTINHWVSEMTHQKITDIISTRDLNELTRLVLVNAIYFNGTWARPFHRTSTQPDTFYLQPDKTNTVPFMVQQESFRYAESARLQAIMLPYSGRGMEMVLLLPRRRGGLEQLEKDLTPANLTAWIASAQEAEVILKVPKFKVTNTFDLAQTLAHLGIKDAFDMDQADFSGIDGNKHGLYVSKAMHKAYVEVNENGTEAAAVMTFLMTLGMHSKEDRPREFRADHPFLFLIRDSQTGTILFIGRVADPSAN